MRLDLRPLDGVGPVRLGSPLVEAESILLALEGVTPPVPFRPRRPGNVRYESGLAIALHPDAAGAVTAIEVYKSEGDVVVLGEVDVFRTPAQDVVSELSSRVALRAEEDGRTVIAEEYSLSLWRPTIPDDPDDEDGRYFESVLVALPGYYSLPGR